MYPTLTFLFCPSRGSADAIKQAQLVLHSLSRDPTQDVHQLIHKLSGTPSLSASLSFPASSAHKCHASSSQDLPLSVPLDMFDELSIAPPARGSTAPIASVNVATPSVLSTSAMGSIRVAQKKQSAPPLLVCQSTSATGVSKTTSDRITVGSKTSTQLGSVSSNKHQGISSMIVPDQHCTPTPKPGLAPGSSGPILLGPLPPAIPFSSSRLLGSGNVFPPSATGNVTTSSSAGSVDKPSVDPTPTSPGAPVIGAVRRLFSQQQQLQQLQQQQQQQLNIAYNPTASVSGGGSSSGASLLGPQPSNFPSLIHQPAPSLALHQGNSLKSSSAYPMKLSTHAGPSPAGNSAYPTKLSTHAGPSPVGSSKQQRSSQSTHSEPSPVGNSKQQRSNHNPSLLATKEKPPPLKTSLRTVTVKAHHPNVHIFGFRPRPPTPPPLGVVGDITDQPMHQIMNTPMLFEEQLMRPRKKSTYSDAVGKKYESMGKVPGTVPLGPGPPSSLPPLQQQQHHKLNLAPGSRPMTADGAGDKVRRW